jgi:hypothetical protein
LELENPWLQKAFEYANQEALLSLKTANTVKSDIKKNYDAHQVQRISKLKVIFITNINRKSLARSQSLLMFGVQPMAPHSLELQHIT